MKILSIDVGIKNLALCILKIPDKYLLTSDYPKLAMTHLLIEKWEVINLCNDDFLCQWNNCISENNISKCNKKAFYTKNGEHYCKTHAKNKTNSLKIPPIETKNLEKKKAADILKFMQDNNIPKPSGSSKKELLLKTVDEYYSTDYFEFVHTISANDINLVDVGKNLRDKMDVFLENENIDKVLIENQIGRLAIRMKSIQGMITQYLIMKNIGDIDFISASNKLKLFVTERLSYDERKKKSIEITTHLVAHISQKHWVERFRLSKKKDDLADSLLQAIWYLSKNYKLENI